MHNTCGSVTIASTWLSRSGLSGRKSSTECWSAKPYSSVAASASRHFRQALGVAANDAVLASSTLPIAALINPAKVWMTANLSAAHSSGLRGKDTGCAGGWDRRY